MIWGESVTSKAISNTLNKALKYIQSQHKKNGAYSLQSDDNPTILSTCFGALGETILTGKVFRSTLRWIQKHQNFKGLFIDPCLIPEDIESLKHTYEYILDQTTYFSTRILYIANWPLSFLPALCTIQEEREIKRWLEKLDWEDPWLESNKIMFALEINKYHSPQKNKIIVEWLMNNIDHNTGYWGTDKGATLVRGMAGAYHFYGFLIKEGFRLPSPKLIIEQTLNLQHSDGLFFSEGGGNSCLDMDAIDIIVLFVNCVPNTLQQYIHTALKKSLDAILAMQKKDGGFPECSSAEARKSLIGKFQNDHDQISQTWNGYNLISYSSWNKMQYSSLKSDLWATLCRIICIIRIGQVLGYRLPSSALKIKTPGIAQMIQVAR